MNKKISLGAAIAYMAIVAAIAISVTIILSQQNFNSLMTNFNERQATYDKLAEIERYVHERYYGSLDNESLLTSTAAGYVAGLGDENSRYMSAKEFEEYSKVESGKYVGIGVVTELSEDGYIRIKTVYPESPAEYVGLRAGDVIISVDDTPAKAENYAELSAGFKGDAGTKLTLVKRQDNSETTLELTRRDIDIPTVQSSYMNGVGYLRFTGITQATASQMDKAIKQLTEQGATSLILDMRGMKSNSMEYIIPMLDSLMPEGDIAYTQAKDGSTQVVATSDQKSAGLPITMLADEGTAGATELLTLAVKELPNCKFVGTGTAGLGSVQESLKLKDGSALVLTTAVYTSYKGTIYNRIGVTPDFDVKLGVATEEEKAAIMGNPDTDLQLRKAIEICQTAAQVAAQNAQSQSSSENASSSTTP